ncbi:metal dependent phosphohydrolase [candidate division TM7 genomosp. GTL1]|nr:metal dependent phosphohydrolase [candidate division TM7 genomosp. GTL1]
MSVDQVIQNLSEALPDIATTLITKYQDMSLAHNQSFAKEPDDPAEHELRWHQYGIITHSRRFEEYFREVVPMYLEKWGIVDSVNKNLAKTIDNTPKAELLRVAALLHDVGKFTARVPGSFRGHEAHSGRIIRTELTEQLKKFKFTEKQIEYIATCTELHYELGKIRRSARLSEGYTMDFLKSHEFKQAAEETLRARPEFALEIGLFFLADNLSKIDIAATGETYNQILAEKPALEQRIATAGLHPNLINAAVQLPVNVKMAKAYLKLWAAAQEDKEGILWLKLNPSSKQKLKDTFPPLYTNQFYDHATLKGHHAHATRSEVAELIGQPANIEVYAYAKNDKVEAVRIHAHGLPDTYGVPHITLSTKQGIQPFESVAMLKADHDEKPVKPLELEGIIEFHPFKKRTKSAILKI